MSGTLRRAVDHYLARATRRPGRYLAFFLLITVLAVSGASRLGLKTDFVELLPPNYQSVKSLHQLIQRSGGNGMLLVVVEGDEFAATRGFVDLAVPRLKRGLAGQIHSLEYQEQSTNAFFAEHALLYLPLEDLQELNTAIGNQIQRAKLQANPLWFDLAGDEQTDAAESDTIAQAMSEQGNAPLRTVEGYYGIDRGRMLLIIIRPQGSHMSVSSTKRLTRQVDAILAEVHSAYRGKNVRYGLCGNVQSSVEEYETVKRDIFSTALLCVGLVALALLLYFRNPWVVLSLTSALLMSVAWTFGLISLFYTHLNTQSAFLAALVIGTGINYGIITLSRFAFERQRGLAVAEAIGNAARSSLAATFVASTTTAAAFLALALAENQGFRQFGYMGAGGVLCCFVGSFLILPPLVVFLQRRGLKLDFKRFPFNWWGPLGLFSWRRAPAMLSLAGIIFVAAAGWGWSYLGQIKETDLTKLRNQISVSSGTEALEKRASQIFRRSLTPAVILTDSLEQSRQVCPALKRQSDARPISWVESCSDLESLVPEQQTEKLATLAEIRRQLDDKSLRLVKGKDLENLNKLRDKTNVSQITLADLPQDLVRHFEELNGEVGRLVYVYPKDGDILSKEPTLMAFTEEVGSITLPSGRVLHAAGEAMILADLIGFLDRDGPKITLWSILGVLALVLLASRSIFAGISIMGSLFLGFVLMWAAMAALQLKVNFFNFVAIPLMFGIGADYAANLYLRLKQANTDDELEIIRVYAHGAGAVALCSLTTIIGYSALITAHNRAVATFAELALLGEFAAILTALIFVPAFLRVFTRGKAKDIEEQPPELIHKKRTPLQAGLRRGLIWLPFLLLAASPAQATVKVLEDFEAGQFNWRTKHDMHQTQPEYVVQKEGQNHILSAAPPAGQVGNIAYKKITMDLQQTPYLSWRWRVRSLPQGADESKPELNDSAASVYVYFQRGLAKYLLKYVWSSSLAPGSCLDGIGSNWFWRIKVCVLQSGPPLNKWVEQTVNLGQDYQRVFGRQAPRYAKGIGVLTDGDQTHSRPRADFDQFILLSEPD